MGLPLSILLFAGLAALAVLFGWLGARPPNPHRGPRLVPWRFLMALAAMGAFVFVVHLVNLAGLATGR